MSITVADLISNGTMSAEVAATIWAAVDEQRSFLTVAIPRFAGKSTLSNAVLALRPPEVPLHQVDGSPAEMERLKRDQLGGYLVVAEFSEAPVPGYIWGEPVRRVFDTLSAGYSLQASLHAPGPEEAVRVITERNGIPDDQASAIDLVLYIRLFGRDEATFWRRLAHVYEVDCVKSGRPVGRTLFRWHEDGDRFEAVEDPRGFARDRADLKARAALLTDLARGDRMSDDDVAAAVSAYRATRPA